MCNLLKTPFLIFVISLIVLSCKKDEQPAATENELPFAKAGDDVTVFVPDAYLFLDARGSYDPDGYISSYLWRKIGGPELPLDITNRVQLELRDLAEGLYEFELKVTDSKGGAAFDTVKVQVVDEFAIGKVPVVDVACPRKIIASTDKSTALLLSAFVEDLGKRYDLKEGFKVIQVSGPSTASISDVYREGGNVVAIVSDLARGNYVFSVEVMRKGVAGYNTATVQVIDDTLVGKEYVFETTWKGNVGIGWPANIFAEIGARPDLFYPKWNRDLQVSIKLQDENWQDVYDELFSGSTFYYAMDYCGQSFKVFAVGEYNEELKDQKLLLRIRYLQ